MVSGFSEEDLKRRLRHQLGLDLDSAAPVASPATGDPTELVRQYVGGTYTVAAFDIYGRNDPFAITSDDLIAVTMLSIQLNENTMSAYGRPQSLTFNPIRARLNHC